MVKKFYDLTKPPTTINCRCVIPAIIVDPHSKTIEALKALCIHAAVTGQTLYLAGSSKVKEDGHGRGR